MIEKMLLLIACHFIGDYPFQNEWFVNFKGKSWEVLFYHCAVYTSVFVLFAKAGWLFSTILVVTHMIIDAMKARYGLIKQIWQDQLLHFLVILLCVFFGII